MHKNDGWNLESFLRSGNPYESSELPLKNYVETAAPTFDRVTA